MESETTGNQQELIEHLKIIQTHLESTRQSGGGLPQSIITHNAEVIKKFEEKQPVQTILISYLISWWVWFDHQVIKGNLTENEKPLAYNKAKEFIETLTSKK